MVGSGKRIDAVKRAQAASSTLRSAAEEHDIDWRFLAAIGVRETGFRNINQKDGKGVGVFQIDLGQNPSVTAAQASDPEWAADWAAKRLAANFARLAANHPNLDQAHLLQATAASYNFGTGNITGNPNTIDVGSAGNNYGSNIMNLMDCFE